LAVDPQQRVSAVKAPSGAELEVRAQTEQGKYQVGPLVEPGVHEVLDEKGAPLLANAFPVLLDPSESDLTHYGEDALSGYFGEESVKASASSGQGHRVPFWTWLIVAAALAFCIEGVLLRK
jgi:hypothetical protein